MKKWVPSCGEDDRFFFCFRSSGTQSNSMYHYRRTAFSSHLKSKVGHIQDYNPNVFRSSSYTIQRHVPLPSHGVLLTPQIESGTHPSKTTTLRINLNIDDVPIPTNISLQVLFVPLVFFLNLSSFMNLSVGISWTFFVVN